jgi:hypothetical protein
MAQSGDLVSKIPAAVDINPGDKVAVNRHGYLVKHDPTKLPSDPSHYLAGIALDSTMDFNDGVSTVNVLIRQNDQWVW